MDNLFESNVSSLEEGVAALHDVESPFRFFDSRQ